MATENVIATCKKHESFVKTGYILGGAMILIGVIFLLLLPLMGILLIAVGIWGIWYRCAVYKNEYIALTDKTIVCYKGIINSKKVSTPLNKIQNIWIEQNLSGKMSGYYTIRIDNAGTGSIEFAYEQMANADNFVSLVQQKINQC